MSIPAEESVHPPSPAPRGRRSGWSSFGRWAGAALAACAVVAFLLIAGLLWYLSTPEFTKLVRARVVGVLEDATGGRVELGSFRWSLRRFAIEADNLTIHGLEGPGEAPYAHVDRLYVRVRIPSFFRPKIALSYLAADHPAFHLIVYPDGSTNQPRPRPSAGSAGSARSAWSTRSATDTIFDLGIGHAEVNHGVAIVNERAIPFSLSANDLGVVIAYAPASDHYLCQIGIGDLAFERGRVPPLRSTLHLEVEAARNALELKALHFTSGGSNLDASGSLDNFAHPRWKLSTQGELDLGELSALAGIDGLREGSVELNLEGRGGPGSPFAVQGNVGLRNAGFRTSYLDFSGLNATASLQVDPDEILLEGFNARLREGGTLAGTVRFLHWNGFTAKPAPLSSVSSAAAKRQPAQPVGAKMAASIRAQVQGVGLPTVLKMVTIRRFQDLGFDTVAEGDVNVDWTGSAEDLTVAAKLQLSVPRSPAAKDLPLSGFVDAKYFNRDGRVEINQFQAHTETTNLQVAGALQVYPLSRPSSLRVHLSTGNLREFDRVLTDLGLAANGKTGVAAIPVELRGQAEFAGLVTGSLIDPDVKGHLTATDFSTVFSVQALTAQVLPVSGSVHSSPVGSAASPSPPSTSIHWDRLDADGEYSSAMIAIQHATLAGNGATIEAQGRLEAHRIGPHQSAFDDSSILNANIVMHNAPLVGLLAAARQAIPVTGTANLQVHAGGSVDNLNGGGVILIRGGAFAGEPYQTINADVSFKGHEVDLTRVILLGEGGRIVANGSYDWVTDRFLGNLDGTGFELARIHRLKGSSIPVAGSLKFDAHASGTIAKPSVLGGMHLTNLLIEGQPAGGLDAVAHTERDTVYFSGHSTLVATQLDFQGQTALQGDFDTKAKLVIAHLDIDPLLKTFNVTTLSGHSAVGGTVDLAGPLKDPRQFSGAAKINQFSVTLESVALSSPDPVVISLRNGGLSLAKTHIVGQDTNLEIAGSAGLLGERPLNATGSGSVNMKLAQTFDPDLTSSGHVDLNVHAAGTVTNPAFTGQVALSNVAVALNDVPNGISKLNGTLIFDQDRLEVENLVGETGGGQVKVTGFITYQKGIYGDLTATGRDIRIRYSGISVTTDTTLHLQGSESTLLLTGNVQITRFIIGPNLDFAVFAGGNRAAPPPDPNAPSNHVRLDVHVTSSPQLDFQNSYAQLAGSVDLRIRGTIAQPSVLGRINIVEGTANFAGTQYQLEHGDIYFTNPVSIDPVIDLDATTRISEYDVTVGLHGTSSHLTPTFRSEPPLPQADVISLLALGRTQQEEQVYSQEQEQAGANSTSNALLGGALNATVSSRVQRLFGVGSVKIDPTYLGNLGNSTARITVQQNISRDVQLTYATNVNTTAEQLIQAQVNITDNVSILAIRDEAEVFSLVLKVHKRLR